MFQIEQTYDLAGLTVLCRAARKTVQKWKGILRLICWLIFAAGMLLSAVLLAYGGKPKVWWFAVYAAILLLLLFEDRLNAWIAKRQMVPGTAHSVTKFDEDSYTVRTDATETNWKYENITGLCETERYYILFLGKRHGQMFDKQGFRWGEPDAFRSFLEKKTGKTFQTIK